VASLKRRGGKLPKGRPVGGKALADRLLMASRAFNLTAETPFNEPRVQRFKRRRMRNRRQIIKPHELHQPFDLAFVVALARPSKAVGKEKMADQFSEGLRALAPPIAENLRYGELGVVIQYR
jgi:hypothetical protein